VRRKALTPGKIDALGWMMSYADMATILLAMFIVLSALSRDQTGITFERATRSLANAREAFGLPGLFSTSSQPIPFEGPTPHYAYAESDVSPGESADDAKPERVLDGDEENLKRFVLEIQRQFPCERQPAVAGRVIVDLYEPLGKKAPYLTTSHTEAISQLLPMLEGAKYRLQLIVWAPTPAPAVWARAVDQASLVLREFAKGADLGDSTARRISPEGQPWRYRDIRRPALSLVLTRQE
jgi:hypothetical protein